MRYPVRLIPDGKYIMVKFPDLPEALTQGNNEKDALVHARDVLESAIEHYLDAKQPAPTPSAPKRGQRTVELPLTTAAKVLLLNEMLAQGVRPAELARRMNVKPQEVTRLTNIRYGSKIDGIAEALRALGKTLEVSVS